MITVAGLIIGLLAGAGQFLLMSRYLKSATSGSFGVNTALYGAASLLAPFGVLTLTAFLWRDALLGIGIGLATGLALCALSGLLLRGKGEKQ